MNAPNASALPPESDQQFDVGSTPDSLDRMRGIYAQLGDAYRVYAPGRHSHTWVFNHPDDVRRILISNHRNYSKGVGFDRIKMLLGNGIIVSEGEFWKRQRRMMQPTFHRRVLAQLSGIITRANAACLARWDEKAARNEPVNITNDMSEMTLEIILRMIFGNDLDAMAAETGDNPFACLTDEAEPTLQNMETLHYAHNVLREALRLYPPVWVISRRTIEADVLGGYEVPANTDVFISPFFVHRHPQYWDDAEAFKPERFETETEHRKLVYLPFSAGAHHCIGETLSIYEGLLHLFKAARRYRLHRVDQSPVSFEALINLRTQQSIFMRLEPRV